MEGKWDSDVSQLPHKLRTSESITTMFLMSWVVGHCWEFPAHINIYFCFCSLSVLEKDLTVLPRKQEKAPMFSIFKNAVVIDFFEDLGAACYSGLMCYRNK